MAEERKNDLTAAAVAALLGPLGRCIRVEALERCASTNRLLKERADALPDWYALVAGEQTAGRGRLGRTFYSPAGTGLYMSVLLRPALSPEDMALITPAAAVAVCEALEEQGAAGPEIKWVNDVLIGGRKVCGILTEGAPDAGWAVVGIGVNVTPPAGGFPPDIASIAGAAFPASRPGLRPALAAAILRRLHGICARLPDRAFAAGYRARCHLAGRQVTVFSGGEARPALALGVDDRCRLLVRWPDGTEQALFSGEISVREREKMRPGP